MDYITNRDIEYGSRQRDDVGEVPSRPLNVDRVRARALFHQREQFALVCTSTIEQVDRNRIIGQVSIVHAVGGNPFPLRPASALLRHLPQTICELRARRIGYTDAALYSRNGDGLVCKRSRRLHVVYSHPRFDGAVATRDNPLGKPAKRRVHAQIGRNERNGPVMWQGTCGCAQRIVYLGKLGLGKQAHAVRRVRDHEAGRVPCAAHVAGEIPRIVDVVAYELRDACALGVGARNLHGGFVHVPSDDARRREGLFALALRLVNQLFPYLGIVAHPAAEPPPLAQEPRGDAGGDQRALDSERARPTHGVDEHPVARGKLVPTGGEQGSRRKRLLQRRLDLYATLSVSATMKRLTRQV